MSILNKMSDKFEVVSSEFLSNDCEIEELIKCSWLEIPKEYLEILQEKNEIEILVNKEKYLRLWSVLGCIEMNDAYNIQKYIPESLAIGDDECCNVMIYANGNKGFGIYIVSLSDLDIDEMIYIADSLEDFLVNNEGIQAFNSVW